ncbi:Methylisocitrate lyase [Penicillium longicatenatum]|uniref:Methylisocitrate lyase n=1 Tax=Penicillium longicatenatum TaxID=1561947 RepID=UPI0025482A47|nr:Methylisocitrate lyase [Penicillium longicatenatum]KAJ5649123.1 Methylisocitrate lyase [Penicillium longicatenatum]
MHGQADLAISTLNDMRSHAEMIAQLDPSIPIIADADTGFGGPIMVARTVSQYARSGVAALHIEDQIQMKRCGHLGGKILDDTESFLSCIRAAVQARKRIGSDIVISARTDASQMYGYEESLARLKAARDAGADMGFLEGVSSKEMARQVVQDLAPWPILLNMVEHGATPIISAEEAKNFGFKAIIVPFAALAPAYVAIKETYEKLKREGITGSDSSFTPQKLFQICGLKESLQIDTEAGSSNFKVGVDLKKA